MPVSPGRYSPSQKYIEQVLVGLRFAGSRISSDSLADLPDKLAVWHVQQHGEDRNV
jgi:hypothetical protein